MRCAGALRWSGALQLSMGAYLLAWALFLLNPAQPAALAALVALDLRQLQHVAIGALLAACGLVELLQGHSRLSLRFSSFWHQAWTLSAALVGVVFLLQVWPSYPRCLGQLAALTLTAAHQ